MSNPFIPITASLRLLTVKEPKEDEDVQQPLARRPAEIIREILDTESETSKSSDETRSVIEQEPEKQETHIESEKEVSVLAIEEEDTTVTVSDAEEKEYMISTAEDRKQKQDLDITSILKQDREKIKELYRRYQTQTSTERKKQICDQVVNEILQQNACQQSAVFPLLKDTSFNQAQLDRFLKTREEDYKKLHEIFYKDSEFDQVLTNIIMHLDLKDLSVVNYLSKNLSKKELQDVGTKYLEQKTQSETTHQSNEVEVI